MTESVSGDIRSISSRKESPLRLRAALAFNADTYFRSVDVDGRTNLESIPQGKKIVFAVSHVTDADLPVAAHALAGDFDLVITDLSIHRNPVLALKSSDPTIGGILIAGRDNFSPIEYTQEKGVRAGRINPNDLDKIRKRLSDGKALVIAAHNPNFDNKLSARPGFVVARIAQSVPDAVVIPVAVDTDRRGSLYGPADIVDRRKAVVHIGKPMTFNDPEARAAGDKIEEIFRKPEMTDADRKTVLALRPVFYKDGERIMEELASMLPSTKQGKWRKE